MFKDATAIITISDIIKAEDNWDEHPRASHFYTMHDFTGMTRYYQTLSNGETAYWCNEDYAHKVKLLASTNHHAVIEAWLIQQGHTS